MHDVIRDVAIAIASREQNVLMVTNDELVNQWELSDESTVKFYTSIVLLGVKTNLLINLLPEVSEYPQLKLISISGEKYLSSTLPDNFFTRMIHVRVLALSNMNIPLLPSSLGFLTNLRTLCLYQCKLQDIAIIGNLKKLEIFYLQGSAIKQLPKEVGQLTQLRLLDLRDCWSLEVISLNVLSKLSHLEELYIGESFDNWEGEVEGLKNASLDELKHLPNLTSLELQIKDVNTLPRGLFFEKLEKYKICIGDKWYWPDIDDSSKCSRTFKLELNTNICLKDGLIVQLKGVEELWLSGLQDIKHFLCEFSFEFSQLKQLIIQCCGAPNSRESKMWEKSTTDTCSNEIIYENGSIFIEKVALPNLKILFLHSIYVERIWQNPIAAMSCGIQNLMHLMLSDCRNLRCLFSSSMVSNFVQLQHLEIFECPVLEDLIAVDQEERTNIMFPLLQFLEMENLPKLSSLCSGDLLIEFPSLKELWISECPEFMVKYKSINHDSTNKVSVFPNLEILTVEAKHMPWICQFTEDFLWKFECLDVEFDESTIFSSLDFLQRFHTMKNLQIIGGMDADEEIENGMADEEIENGMMDERVENGMTTIIKSVNCFCDPKQLLKPSAILDNLEKLEIWDLECFDLINLLSSSTTFQYLTILKVWNCNELIKLLTSSTARSLIRLRKMKIGLCNTITEIVTDEEGDKVAKYEIVFSELKALELVWLDSLTCFYSGNCAFKFPSLETLLVDHCPNMKIFSEGELSTPKLHKVQRRRGNSKCLTWKGDLNSTIQHLYLEKGDEATEEDNEEGSEESHGSEED